MSIFVFVYMAIMFIAGILVGIVIENEHNKQQRIKRDKSRHPALGSSIESQMAKDGWKI
jgi:hypothetical protein